MSVVGAIRETRANLTLKKKKKHEPLHCGPALWEGLGECNDERGACSLTRLGWARLGSARPVNVCVRACVLGGFQMNSAPVEKETALNRHSLIQAHELIEKQREREREREG